MREVEDCINAQEIVQRAQIYVHSCIGDLYALKIED